MLPLEPRLRHQVILYVSRFAYAALFSPRLSTLEKALKAGCITGFPALSLEALWKYPPEAIVMHKGHMDHQCKNILSTKSLAIESTANNTRRPV